MTYPSPRYLRFCAWCHRKGKEPMWLAYGYWLDAGEPAK